MGRKKGTGGSRSFESSISIREEATGKLNTKVGARNPRSFLRLDHLRSIALWSSKESSIPPLAAFFGRQFAAAAEVLSAPRDPNLFSCQRCETILQPGMNCTVRIEKVRKKMLKNNVVYKCSYCAYSNTTPGTKRRYLKDLFPQKKKHLDSPVEDLSNSVDPKSFASLPIDCSATPLHGALLSGRRRKRNKSGSCEPSASHLESAVITSSQKKRRKSWVSSKDIVASSQKDKFPLPFFL